MKKLFCSLLAVLFTFGTIPALSAFAADTGPYICGENATYIYDDTSCTLTISGEGALNTYCNTTEAGYKVLSVTPWENIQNEVRTVVINEGITTISEGAFLNFSSLCEIKLPSTIKTIEPYAFYNCKQLETINIPQSIKSIGYEAFWNCEKITSFSFGAYLSSIGNNCFFGCKALQSFSVTPDNQYYTICNGILYNKIKTIAICCPANYLKQPTLSIITSVINPFCFAYNQNISTINIPKKVKFIKGAAFYGCSNLSTVTFEKNSQLTAIIDYYNYYGDDVFEQYGAFENCKSLKSFSLPEKVEYIDTATFRKCPSLSTLYLGKNFKNNVGNNYSVIYSNFYKSYLKNIYVSSKNKIYTSVKGVLYSKNKQSLWAYPAKKTAKTYTTLSSLKTIKQYAFNFCSSLKTIKLTSKVKTLDQAAIINCKKITKITVPKAVKTLKKCCLGYELMPNKSFSEATLRKNF